MPKTRARSRSFTAPGGKTLFITDGDRIRIFGQDGTEASIPVSDLESFQQFLADQSPDPPSEPGAGLHEDKK